MKTSLKGILAIINEEALVLSTYRDAAGVLTIGVGHTAAAGLGAQTPAAVYQRRRDPRAEVLTSSLVRSAERPAPGPNRV